MTEDSVSFSPTALRAILQKVAEQPEWQLKPQFESVDVELDPVVAGDRSSGELFFTHRSTNAQLTVRYPERFSDALVTILVEYPLDSRFQPAEGGFLGHLYQTQEAIADRYETRYLHGEQSPSVIAKAHIPEAHDESKVDATTSALTTIADEISEVHSELSAVLDSYPTYRDEDSHQ